MVLVDTSVWIRALAGREPYKRQVDWLLERDEVLGHEFVFGELLIGDRGGRRQFLDSYVQIDQAETVAHQEVVQFVRGRSLHGLGIGWIDVHLLASALVSPSFIWTVDPRFAALAEEFGIAYNPAKFGGGGGS